MSKSGSFNSYTAENLLISSLLRTNDLNEARSTFDNFKLKLPPLFDLDPDLCTQPMLQLLCDALRKTPSLSLAHLAVMFDLKKVAANKDVLT